MIKTNATQSIRTIGSRFWGVRYLQIKVYNFQLIAESCGGGAQGNINSNYDRPEGRLRENEIDLFEINSNNMQ